MRSYRFWVAILILGPPAALDAQGNGETIATCHATLEADVLTTVIEFTNGYSVSGPWRVVGRGAMNGEPGVALDVRLDRVVERDPNTGERITTPFPRSVETRFQGPDEEAMVAQAAQIWCMSVLRVQQTHPSPYRDGGPPAGSQPSPAAPAAPAPAPGKSRPVPALT